ncbi:MAG: YraN family protein [Saprospiraceae bacterium]|nr:YraN family protein [Saprospiraceae bacterium]
MLLAELIASQKDTEARFKETEARFKETADRFKDTDKRINKAFELFESQWGKLIEALVEGDLVRVLNERGIAVAETATRRKGRRGGHNYEFDIIAHDTTQIVVVEVKTTLRVKHVEHFLEKMSHAKEWMAEYKNYEVLGAVAFLLAEEAADTLAEKKGLFVIRATGDSAAIVNADDFQPRRF